ncbi:hypothetical protein [Caulifigura coniformis]|nr:hypothetical protein [Caulifigura coniformis]
MFLAAVVLVGCGSGEPEFHQLRGNATFDGKPIVYGTIEFIPDKGLQGPAGNADIVDGVYDTSAAGGKGLSKGPHIARITFFAEKLPPTNDDETVTVKGPLPIAIGFPIEVTVDGPTLDLAVPANAKGFDMFKGASHGRRSNET